MSVPPEWAELGAKPSVGGDPEEWLRQFTDRANAMAKQGQEAQAALAANNATIENKHVRVTVVMGGMVDALTFLPGATAASATQLTESFNDAYNKACAQVTRANLAMMSALVGEDDPSLQLMRDSVPAGVQAEIDADDERDNR